MTAPAEFGALQPIEHEQCALESAQFGKREIEPVLPRERRKLFQDDGGSHCAGSDRSGEPDDLIPMFANDVNADRTAEQSLDPFVDVSFLDGTETIILEITKARHEAES